MSDMYLNPGVGRDRLDGSAAERVAVGSMLHGDDPTDEVRAVLRPDDFGQYVHRVVFDSCCRLRDGGKPVDLVGVRLDLIARGHRDDLGPNPDLFLYELFEAVPTAANAGLAARMAKEAAQYRALRRLAADLMRNASDGVSPADQLAAEFEARVGEVMAATAADGPRLIGDLMPAVLAEVDRVQKGEPTAPPIPTGLGGLDQVLAGGLHPGQLAIVAARPARGKSALALRPLVTAARAGVPTLLFSLEMSAHEQVLRLLAGAGRVHLHRLRGGSKLAPGQSDQLLATADQLRVPLYLDDRSGRTLSQLLAAARRMIHRKKVRLIVVDYAQLVVPDDPRQPRHLQVGEVSTRLKRLAMECQVAVLALAQLNRAVESRADGRPLLSDLRDSGQLEQDADVVALLHAPDPDETVAVHRVEVIVGKNRNGPTTVVPLDFHRPFVRFEEAVPT